MSTRRVLAIFCAGIVLLSFLVPVTGEAQSLKVENPLRIEHQSTVYRTPNPISAER